MPATGGSFLLSCSESDKSVEIRVCHKRAGDLKFDRINIAREVDIKGPEGVARALKLDVQLLLQVFVYFCNFPWVKLPAKSRSQSHCYSVSKRNLRAIIEELPRVLWYYWVFVTGIKGHFARALFGCAASLVLRLHHWMWRYRATRVETGKSVCIPAAATPSEQHDLALISQTG